MRIIAGKAGRVAIKVPTAVARPTTDFVRQAVFSMLAARVEDARVLDLFGGSGAIGLEALSRGSTHPLSAYAPRPLARPPDHRCHRNRIL